jgi:hypothetical protein
MTIDRPSYQGSCFCGAVEFTVTGEAVAQGYCHCASCRAWSAGPVNAFTLWAPEALEVTKGGGRLGVYNKSELSYRQFCTACGGHLFTAHPPLKVVDVYAAVLREFPFRPSVHVNYEDTVHRMKDGLPKCKDFPSEMGGSGVMLAD